MNGFPRFVLALPLLVFLLVACQQFTLVRPGPTEMGGTYSIRPGISWNRALFPKRELWTVDGPLLQDLYFFKGLENGDALFRGANRQKPRFRRTMNQNQIKKFIETSFTLNGYGALMTGPLRPQRLGRARGFRFDFSYALRDGLEKRGFAVGLVLKGRLHLILYRAATLYYFGKYKTEAERIIRSIRLL